MKHFYFFLFSFFALNLSFGQTIIFQENFNDDTQFTKSETFFTDGTDDYFGILDPTGNTDDFDGFPVVGGIPSYSAFDGNYLIGEDLDGGGGSDSKTLTWSEIDISGFSNLSFSVLLGADTGGFDAADEITFAVNVDDGGYTDIISFSGSGTNTAATNGSIDLSRVLQEIVVDIDPGGSLMNIRLTVKANSGGEEFAIDSIKIIDGYQSSPSLSITSPAQGEVIIPGTTSVNLEWVTTNLSGSETVDVVVNETTTNNATSPFEISTADGTTYGVTVNLVNGGTTVATDNVSFSIESYTPAADLSVVRAGNVGDYFELSNEVIFSYIVTESGNGTYRNQKYIQDAGGGILIDDVPGTLSTAFDVGDGVTGLRGKLNSYGGILQLNPVENIASASSTNNSITPEVVTLADFLANSSNYQSELIKIENVTFSATGVFADNTDYVITSGAGTSILRVVFGDENLIGANIPTTSGFIIGLGAEYSGTPQIYPRYASDVERVSLSLNNFSAISFNLYPNPTNTGFVTIKSNQMGAVQAQVFDLLGKEVVNTVVNNERLDVSNLNAGVYVVKLTQNKNTTTKKLIIQ
ncbi:T9SS type A sorting domain-containing protein [Flavobacteriaceae bacterium]|nr:T9SS type A sorting domain-containing protein [Flavobacteriaceae bacterium]